MMFIICCQSLIDSVLKMNKKLQKLSKLDQFKNNIYYPEHTSKNLYDKKVTCRIKI